jgi:hypothetical protein
MKKREKRGFKRGGRFGRFQLEAKWAAEREILGGK